MLLEISGEKCPRTFREEVSGHLEEICPGTFRGDVPLTVWGNALTQVLFIPFGEPLSPLLESGTQKNKRQQNPTYDSHQLNLGH